MIAITIPRDEYFAGIESYKNNLHGYILKPKGTTMLKIDALHAKLSSLWKSIGKWTITSLCKG